MALAQDADSAAAYREMVDGEDAPATDAKKQPPLSLDQHAEKGGDIEQQQRRQTRAGSYADQAGAAVHAHTGNAEWMSKLRELALDRHQLLSCVDGSVHIFYCALPTQTLASHRRGF